MWKKLKKVRWKDNLVVIRFFSPTDRKEKLCEVDSELEQEQVELIERSLAWVNSNLV